MPEFLGLPFEVREMIYNHYFTVGRIYPYLERQLKEEKAQVDVALLKTTATLPSRPMIREKRRDPAVYLDLLQVNKSIHKEATHIVYQKNRVVLPHAQLTATFFENCLNTVEKRRWLKRIEVEFCVSDMSLDEKKDWFRSKRLDLPAGNYLRSTMSWIYEGEHLTDAFEKERDNDWRHYLGEVIWPRKLAPILEDTKLDSLCVEFTNSRCPTGCCYLHNKACAAFRKGFAHGMVKDLFLLDLPPWQPCDQEPLEEGLKGDDREITGLVLSVVPEEDAEEDRRRYALRAGEQIARWTRARELGLKQKNGTRKWFREAEVEEEEGKLGFCYDYEPGS